ncbi:DUF2510 domain-containing protein [Mariniluteicoccus flavus]
MSTPSPLPPPGWYADPGGVPGRLRWWDGSAWSPQVRDDRPRGRRTPWLLAGAALALVVVMVIALPALTNPTRTGPATRTGAARPERTPTFGPTGSGGPVPAPTISAERPTTGPTVRDTVCGSGDPDHRQNHPKVPGRITGGGLQVALPAGWTEQAPPRLPFGNDMAGAAPGGDSVAWAAVGAVRAETEEFAAPVLAARTMADCLQQLPEYRGMERRDATVVPATVPGSRETSGLLVHLGVRGGGVMRTILIVVSDTGAAESMPFVIAQDGPGSDARVLAFAGALSKQG